MVGIGVLVMSPMEFRPVTARDIAARTQRGPAPAVAPTAAQPLDYALNPDRAWAPSPERIRLEARRLTFKLQELRGRPMRVRETDRDRTELFALGMLDAVCWTLGDSPERPMDQVEAPVCDAEVFGQIRAAQLAVKAGGANWAPAAGIAWWLQWLIGEIPAISYPDEWDLDSGAKRASPPPPPGGGARRRAGWLIGRLRGRVRVPGWARGCTRCRSR
jgi:hypothetical protein